MNINNLIPAVNSYENTSKVVKPISNSSNISSIRGAGFKSSLKRAGAKTNGMGDRIDISLGSQFKGKTRAVEFKQQKDSKFAIELQRVSNHMNLKNSNNYKLGENRFNGELKKSSYSSQALKLENNMKTSGFKVVQSDNVSAQLRQATANYSAQNFKVDKSMKVSSFKINENNNVSNQLRQAVKNKSVLLNFQPQTEI